MKKWKKQGLKPDTDANSEKKISRKEALEKAGKYAAFTAAAAIVLLSPLSAQTVSPDEVSPARRGRDY